MKEALCQAFCAALTVTQLPTGFAVGTGFKRGPDALGFYMMFRKGRRDLARLEDDGLTVAYLQDAGLDVFDGPRGAALAEMMAEFEVRFDKDDCLFHTEDFAMDDLPARAPNFIAFLLRVQDFALLTRERVEETFKSDVISAVTAYFAGRAVIGTNEAPIPELENYIADVVIRPEGYPPLALYIGSSETKALEAILLHKEAAINHVTCSVMLVVKNDRPSRIKKRTLARVNGAFLPETWDGRATEVLADMDRQIYGSHFRNAEAERETVRH